MPPQGRGLVPDHPRLVPSIDFTGFLASCRIRPLEQGFQASDQGWNSKPVGPVDRAGRRLDGSSGLDGMGTEQNPELTHQPAARVHVELGWQPEHLVANMEQHRRVPRVVGEQALQVVDGAIGEGT